MSDLLNKEQLSKKPNKSASNVNETVAKNNTVSSEDNESLRDKLREFGKQRADEGLITDTNRRATFLVSEDTLEDFNNIVDYIEATNGVDSTYKEDKSIEEIRKERQLAKGFKSKALNLAVNNFIAQWKRENETPKNVFKTTYRDNKKKNHRVFMFTLNGATYGIEQDERGHELVYLATDRGNTKEEIAEWFESRQEIHEQQSKKKKK